MRFTQRSFVLERGMHPDDTWVAIGELGEGVLLNSRVFDLLQLDQLRFAEDFQGITLSGHDLSGLHDLSLRVGFRDRSQKVGWTYGGP